MTSGSKVRLLNITGPSPAVPSGPAARGIGSRSVASRLGRLGTMDSSPSLKGASMPPIINGSWKAPLPNLVLEYFPVLHHEPDILQHIHVLQRIALHGD